MPEGITIRVEPLGEVIGELDNLLHEYWKATDAGKGMPSLAMDWDAFSQIERQQMLLLLVAREGRRVVGFLQYMLMRHMKHRNIRIGYCDTLAVKVSERGKGIGAALVKAGEHELRKRGVQQALHGFRTVYNSKPLFPKLGYKMIEHIYMKEL